MFNVQPELKHMLDATLETSKLVLGLNVFIDVLERPLSSFHDIIYLSSTDIWSAYSGNKRHSA